MSNMSYCRFQNTLSDLRDCNDHLTDDLSNSEQVARERILNLCLELIINAMDSGLLEEEDVANKLGFIQ